MANHHPDDREFFASCLAGLEQLLADELRALHARRVRPLHGGVAFFGDAERAMRVCLWSRLASRVTCVVGRVNAGDSFLLYEGVRRIAWDEVVAPGASIAVRAHGTNAELRNSHFTELRVKDGVCDALREARGERPEVDVADADLSIDVRIRDARATLSVDLTGESLYRRTYLREDDGQDAPLECALAAGTLAFSGWGDDGPHGAALVDPACGDGALVVEAASVAADAAPGLARDRWGFMGWSGFDEDAWNRLLDEADERFERGLASLAGADALAAPAKAQPDLGRVRIVGLSESSPAISRGRDRAKRAGLRLAVSIERGGAPEAPATVDRAICAARAADAAARAAAASAQDGCVGADGEGGSAGGAASEHVSACAPCYIASSQPTGDRVQSDARAQAEASSFVAAAKASPEGSVRVIAGGEGVEARYGAATADSLQLGQGRIECEARLYFLPPRKGFTAIVPDTAGGAEHRVEVMEEQSQQFADRLRKVAKERRKWAKREGVTCYRIYDADLPDYAAAIDLYTGAGQAEGNVYLHIAEYAAPSSIDPDKAQRRFDDILALAPVVLGVRPDHVFSKVRRRDKGGGQYRRAGRRSYVTHVEEAGCLLEVDLSGYLDTGLFLDHRETRAMLRGMAEGKRFLNLFAYTGAATVQAAAGGAVETVTVDLSPTYLEWAVRNMEQNGFDGPEHMFERGDVMRWVTECRRQPRRFDLVFVDPPTFSNSKAMGRRTWDVQRDHVELLIGVSRLLTEGGEAVFSCNLRTFKPDVEGLAKYGVEIEDIAARTIPHDFERNPRIHKCYLVRRSKN